MIVRWRAPGRVNLIGEHTDYNDGLVFPCAIQYGCTATLTPRDDRTDRTVSVRSAQQADPVEVDLGDLRPTDGWADYALGPVAVAIGRGADVPGLSIELDSDVPLGAGLSSSAAVVCSVATALDDLLGEELDADALLAATRAAENDFVGAPTGGMDQLAALRCTEGHALLCDMRSLETESVPLALTGTTLLVVDTHAPHRHVDGEYRRRREGCEAAAAALGVPALRDIDAAGLDAALGRLVDDEQRRYTRHVVTENDRVRATAGALRSADLTEVGRLFSASHDSMRDDFRITVPEVDTLQQTLLAAGAFGARMTGGGFGGCVIALLPDDRVEAATAAVTVNAAEHDFATPTWFAAEASASAHRVG